MIRTLNEKGITVVELLIVVVATGIMSGTILLFTFQYWRFTYSLQSDLESLTNRLNAGDTLRTLISSSTGLIIQTSIPDDNALVPDLNNGMYWQENHAIPTSFSADVNAYTPIVYFKRFSFDSSREIIFNDEEPFEDEYVLYIDGSDRTLYLRSLANPSAPNNSLQTSCPPASATITCPADRVIAEDIASIDMRYFSRTGNSIDFTSMLDEVTGEHIGPDFPAAEVAEFTLNITRSPFYQEADATRVSTVIRVALRN